MNESQRIAAVLGWLAGWIGFGILALYYHNSVLPYLYLALAAGTIASHLYLACTRCFYYGKKCYALGGLASAAIFKQRKEGPLDPDDAINASLWFLLTAFPIPFLIYYQDWVLVSIYVVLFSGWYAARKSNVCRYCKNEWCPAKPR
jgi:hypothetical protein